MSLATLFALDARLAQLTRFTRDPMVARLRLTWWHDALRALDTAPALAEPLLQAVADHLLPHMPGAQLAGLIDGWEELLDGPVLEDDGLARYADGRGGGFVAAAAAILDIPVTADVSAAGRGWALVDLAEHTPDSAVAAAAMAKASPLLRGATARYWPVAARPIGALAHLATMPRRSPAARSARVIWHRLTGR